MVSLPKDYTQPIASQYHPVDVESEWYEWWESNQFFLPRSGGISPTCEDATDVKKENFVIVIPPPNVTGYLHLGHALTTAVQDTLIRYHRMKGHNTLYVPGMDHAGIATQVVVEKRIQATEGVSRHQLGRETFISRVWEWKKDHGGVITQQLRLLGSSVDWSRERFTMDSKCSAAVQEAFVRFHEEGLIYRSTRLVNWCPTLQSAISDLEVEYIDVTPGLHIRIPNYEKTVDVGTMTSFAYHISGSEDEIIVDTTRPETILGDTAVAVHPDDPRYQKYKGTNTRLVCPFREDTIPLLFDSVLVDMNFGTGAVKITPAHDPNDFQAGERHALPFLTVMDEEGKISTKGEFHGMHRYDCRRAIVKALDSKGLLRGQRGHTMRLGICSRTQDIVEPHLVPQWFVNCSTMAQRSVQAVRTGELKLIPSVHEATWYRWLENIKPWCISRQLWWGHRIPAYSLFLDGKPLCREPNENWIVGRTAEEARSKASLKHRLSSDETSRLELRQDEDVLDTWFSSALWPFSVLGWPDLNDEDFKTFFPTSLLETGHDILFFWVARVVMCSLHLVGKLPFKEVYMHAMVRDKSGDKMSKSKGNVVDPLDVLRGITLEKLQEKIRLANLAPKEVEKAKALQQKAFPKGIPECGADALRLGLLSYTVSGKSVNLDIDRILGYRQFCNKLWNAVRYALYFALGEDFEPPSSLNEDALSLSMHCRWILSRLDACTQACNISFREYDFSTLTTAIYRFWLYDFCDVFLELTKPVMQHDGPLRDITRAVLCHCMEHALRLLHPMMPFVTEELWHRLPGNSSFVSPSIMLAPYPQSSNFRNESIEEGMTQLLDVVHALRSLKTRYRLTNKVKPDAYVVCHGKSNSFSELFTRHAQDTLAALAVLGHVEIVSSRNDVPLGCATNVLSSSTTVCLQLQGLINPAEELARLEKGMSSIKLQKESLCKKIESVNYKEKVPESVREANSMKLSNLTAEMERVTEAKESLQGLL